jgi:hypothetical protein
LALGRYIYVLGSGRTPVFVGIHELCNSSLRQTAQLNISEQYSRVNTEAVVFSMSIDIAYLLIALRRVTTIVGALNLGRKHIEVDYSS